MSQQAHIVLTPRGEEVNDLRRWRLGVYESLRRTVRGRAITLGSGAVDLLTVPIVSGRSYLGEVVVVARQKDGVGGAANNAFGSVVLVKFDAGGVSSTDLFEQKDEAWADSYVVASGIFAVRVAGLTDRTIVWNGVMRLQEIVV